MVNYEFLPADEETFKALLCEYAQTLTGVVDDFFEAHVLDAAHYLVARQGAVIGCMAMKDQTHLTLFFILPQYRLYAQEAFLSMLRQFDPKTAFAATCDEQMVALCMDAQKKVECQAYFFDGRLSLPARPPEFARESLTSIKDAGLLPQINRQTDDFFGFISPKELDEETTLLYALVENGRTLGYGIIVKNVILTGFWACGMIALESERRKGVGRSIQMHLGDICREGNGIPISGCWYHNHLSKKTIESAGRPASVRLLKVYFRIDGDEKK